MYCFICAAFVDRKMNSLQKIDVGKKKIPDYTETAYREAVSKLKYLLAESYTPRSTGYVSTIFIEFILDVFCLRINVLGRRKIGKSS